jgi:acyl-CoA thioesterase-1
MLRTLLIALALLVSGWAHAGPAILVYGDSLSAAYGISQKDGWVTLLQERLKQKRLDYTVVNASISGETSSGGASRIVATLAQHQPAIVILAAMTACAGCRSSRCVKTLLTSCVRPSGPAPGCCSWA